MPIYVIKNKETEEIQEKLCSYDQLQEWLSVNPGWSIHIGSAPSLARSVGTQGPRKVDDGFKEVMSKIKKNNPVNSIPDF